MRDQLDGPRIIVALDYPNTQSALELVAKLDPALCRLKVGKELFTRAGPAFIEALTGRGFELFLDLKFHDIPNTVASACAVAADLGVWMINVHALGGRGMMEAARERLDGLPDRPLLVAVTILTSMEEGDLNEVGLSGVPVENVSRLARLAADSGMDGVVCSAQEATAIRADAGEDFLLVTPGIRPGQSSLDDQKRATTPAEAIRNGSDLLVIGRSITGAADPVQALTKIEAEISVNS